MDPKHIPKATPHDVARQRRILGIAVVAGAAALYYMVVKPDETKKAVDKVSLKRISCAGMLAWSPTRRPSAGEIPTSPCSIPLAPHSLKVGSEVDRAARDVKGAAEDAADKAADKLRDVRKKV